MARTADEVLELNQILQEINIPDRDVSVKGATSKQVTYVVKSDDRDGTKSDVEGLISRIGRVYEEQRSVSSIPVSCVRMSDGTVLTFIYKPRTGGMSMTTLNHRDLSALSQRNLRVCCFFFPPNFGFGVDLEV